MKEKSKSTSINMTEEDYEAFKIYAKDNAISLSSAITMLARKQLQDIKLFENMSFALNKLKNEQILQSGGKIGT